MSRAYYFWEEEEEEAEEGKDVRSPHSSRARTRGGSLSKHVVYLAWRVLRWASSIPRGEGGATHYEEAGPGG